MHYWCFVLSYTATVISEIIFSFVKFSYSFCIRVWLCSHCCVICVLSCVICVLSCVICVLSCVICVVSYYVSLFVVCQSWMVAQKQVSLWKHMQKYICEEVHLLLIFHQNRNVGYDSRKHALHIMSVAEKKTIFKTILLFTIGYHCRKCALSITGIAEKMNFKNSFVVHYRI